MNTRVLLTIPVALTLVLLFGCGRKSAPVVTVSPNYNYRSISNQSSYYNSSSYSPYASAPTSYGSETNAYHSPRLVSANSSTTYNSLRRSIRVVRDIMPRHARGRTGSPMTPRYITIHSTQNWSRGADAYRHSLALKNSKLGRISWHYTIDENVAIQHLPDGERGNHADHDGPGNHYSIGIEMCEHPGNSRSATVDRTARLTAYLMRKHNLPLSRIVPHYHWPRWGKNPPNKNCPHFLLDNGRPGFKWKMFLSKVNRYYRSMSSSGGYVRRQEQQHPRPESSRYPNVSNRVSSVNTPTGSTEREFYHVALKH